MIWVEKNAVKHSEEETEPLRDFFLGNLREFNGVDNPKIYVAIMGDVFDVSANPEKYGPKGWYPMFGGRDASRAFAKFSFEQPLLDDPHIDDIRLGEKDSLLSWYHRFRYEFNYPIIGRLSTPPKDLEITRSILSSFKGDYWGENLPAGHPFNLVDIKSKGLKLCAPILISIQGIVYDVSYSTGPEFYHNPSSGYSIFAGHDVTVSFAKTSLDVKLLDTKVKDGDLTAEELVVLGDWVKKFEKKYAKIGRLVD